MDDWQHNDTPTTWWDVYDWDDTRSVYIAGGFATLAGAVEWADQHGHGRDLRIRRVKGFPA